MLSGDSYLMKKILALILLLSSHAFAFDWQGHRGARGLYPENTIGSMEEALKYPVTTLEMDVVATKDHLVVVSHEPWMGEEICLDVKRQPVKMRQYNLYKLNYEDIQKFDCGSKPHPRFPRQQKISVGKPTIEKLIDVIEPKLKELNRSDVSYNIEIKSSVLNEKTGFQPEYRKYADIVIQAIKKKLPSNRFTLQSFDFRILKYIHETYPDIRLVALVEESFDPQKVISELGFRPFIFSPNYRNLFKEHVDAFHAMGVKVIPWTVNEVEDMEALISIGVDGIITDYPDKISQVGTKRCKSGYNLFENRCVKVPTHAVPSSKNPGWMCRPGFVQKRSRCHKIAIPKNAHLSPDGRNWECDKGYSRYRSSCKK